MSQLELERPIFEDYAAELTDLSAEHGVEGLRTRVQERLGQIGLRHHDAIQAAIELGLDLHSDNRRTYEPYNNHLLRVTLLLIDLFDVEDPATLAAAPLHDAIEDHAYTLAEEESNCKVPAGPPNVIRALGYGALKKFELRHNIEGVAKTVLAVSNPFLAPGESKIESYNAHVEKLMLGDDPRAKMVKMADLLDNTLVVKGENPDKRLRLDRKQIGVYSSVLAGLERSDSPVKGESRERLVQLVFGRYEQATKRLRGDKSHNQQ